ncbi:TRAP transporter substrate-binding protein [bacterium LRH843]|nr:TRAP transporter substrate-binding protein [bacterium LRH843]
MKAFRFLSVMLVMMSLIVLAACGGNPSSTDPGASDSNDQGNNEKAQVIKIASVNNSTHPAVVAVREKFKPLVEENSGGKLKVEIFDNAQLGGERDTIEQIQLGQLQMAIASPVLGSIYKPINLLDLPYLFEDYKHLDTVLDGELGQEILDGLPEVGLHGFSYMENGFRQITNSVREINNLDDLKGLKIRVPEAPISVANLTAIGANVVTMSFNELYSALQQGVVDGQENAYPTLVEKKLWEVQDYVAETNHMWGAFVILGSEKWYQQLSPDLQEVVNQAAKEASLYQRELFRESQEADKQTLIDNGMTITTPDLTEFNEAANSVYEEFYKENPELAELVKKIRSMGD